MKRFLLLFLVIALVVVFMAPLALASHAGGHQAPQACFGMSTSHGGQSPALHPYGQEVAHDAHQWPGRRALTTGIHNACRN